MVCFLGICDWLRGQLENEERRAKFEKVVLFLSSVPIFRRQLPRAELPKLAQLLKERTWAPGKRLVKEGETGRTFFLIYSGQASVMTCDAEGRLSEHAVLSEGDWLGGHTLTSERPNVATVIAKGPEPLVTLEMTKREFEQSGLASKLHFSKRPAMRVSVPQVDQALGQGSCCSKLVKDSAEVDFIMQSIGKNPNLRPFMTALDSHLSSSSTSPGHSCADTVLREIAATAERRVVTRGTEVASFGELGQEFFIIREGSFEVLIDPGGRLGASQRSAESALSSISLAERIQRKQDFMMQLHRPIVDNGKCRVAQSVLMKDPRDERAKRRSAPRVASWLGRGETKDMGRCGTPAAAVAADLPRGPQVVATLRSGESFGELSLLYNTRREATFRAAQDSILYIVGRRRFKQLTGRQSGRKKFTDCCKLLDEVDVLQPLLRSERRELATNMADVVKFQPNQRILMQGKVRESAMWYVVAAGSAVLSNNDPCTPGGCRRLGEIRRGSYFGERSLLREECTGSPKRCVSEMNVDAGPDGLTCVTFDGELIRDLFRGLALIDSTSLPNMQCDDVEWERSKLARFRTRSSMTIIDLHGLKEVCVLGRGGFGTVFLTKTSDNSLYAVKRISKGLAQRDGNLQQLCWERDLMSMLDSPFIIKLVCTHKDAQFVYLVLEAALGGDLYKATHRHQEVFSQDTPRGSSAAFYAACVIAGLEHLHERRIVYRDVKPENVLLSTRGYGKICDMGLARFVCGKTNTQVGTPDYMAPEMIDPPHYHDFSVDWWALGVLVFELLSRQTPFDDDGVDDMQERLLAIRRNQEHGSLMHAYDCPVAAKGFIERLLRKLPNRLGAEGGAAAVRAHPWLKKFDFEALHAQTLPSPLELTWEEPQNPEIGGLHSPILPSEGDPLFVPYEDEGTSWDEDF